MTTSTKYAALAASALVIALAAPGAAVRATEANPTVKMLLPTDQPAKATVMQPGQRLPLDVGGKRTTSYFEAKNDVCALVVEFAADGPATNAAKPAASLKIPVGPGRTVKVDTLHSKFAEFLCGPNGDQMSARVFDVEAAKKL